MFPKKLFIGIFILIVPFIYNLSFCRWGKYNEERLKDTCFKQYNNHCLS